MADESRDQDFSATNLSSFPPEILEYIIAQPQIHINDIYNLFLVSTSVRDCLNSNELWKKKVYQRWPDVAQKIESLNFQAVNWKQICREKIACRNRVNEELYIMPRNCFDKDEVPKKACNGLLEVVDSYGVSGYIYVVDELQQVLNRSDSNKKLTVKYYAQRALKIIEHHELEKQIRHYTELPAEKQIPEIGASIIASWCLPTEENCKLKSFVTQQLNDIAAQVRSELLKREPALLLDEILEEFTQEQLFARGESVFDPEKTRTILEVLNYVFFDQLGYKANSENYYDVNNSFINQVLKRRTGIPISMAVVYMSVARRLGVVCLPVNFPQHFLLKWKEHPNLANGQEYTYIDVFNRGRFLTPDKCKNLRNVFGSGNEATSAEEDFYAVCMLKVLQRMVRNLYAIAYEQGSLGDGLQFLCDILQITVLFEPTNTNAKLGLAKFYLNMGINLEEADGLLVPLDNINAESQFLVSYLRQAIAEQQAREVYPPKISTKARNAKVKFSVGLIMKHKKYNYFCVIYGWDDSCKASTEWIHHMGVHNLPKGQWQPFYNVLVEDGSNRYAAQENLLLVDETPEIPHPQIGKYFDEYCDDHYVPNSVRQEMYPDDCEKTSSLLKAKYGEKKSCHSS